MAITDRLRFTIIQVNTNQIVARDLVVQEPTVMLSLSAPSRCTFKVLQGEQFGSASAINWKTWGYWVIPEIEIDYVKHCLGAQIINKVDIDSKTGDVTCEGLGFIGYPKGIPWLVDYNPIAVDPAEVVQKIWADVQGYTNANLGVEVLPASLGLQMLPGYSFDGNVLNFDFFAMFNRQVDFQDSGDILSSLARDIPFDMREYVQWNSDGVTVTKIVELGYPYVGVEQDYLAFILGENVITAELAEELEIEPVSDVIIRSWRPGKTVSSQLSNADMTRVRRVIMEEDANIDSTERAAAWAKRKLTRRNIPRSFSKVTVDASHPNAPFGSYNVGDFIYVEAKNYPWYGDIAQWHRITSITLKNDEPTIELGLKVDGAFNYDPIEYNPNYANQPTTDTNKLANGYFTQSMSGWTRKAGQWIHTLSYGYSSDGCVYVYCDDGTEKLESHRVSVDVGAQYKISAWVKRQSVVTESGTNPSVDGIYLSVGTYIDGGYGMEYRIAGLAIPTGTGPWTKLEAVFTMPTTGLSGTSVYLPNELSAILCASRVTGGIMYWDDVRIVAV